MLRYIVLFGIPAYDNTVNARCYMYTLYQEYIQRGATENDNIINRDHLNKTINRLECVQNQFDDACQLFGDWQIEINTICPTVC